MCVCVSDVITVFLNSRFRLTFKHKILSLIALAVCFPHNY